MSAPRFRSFQMTRPDHERWELVKGIPVMMVPPTIIHNRIAGNLERLLNDALAKHNPARFAVQGAGVELGAPEFGFNGDNYRPEPDVVVIDADCKPGQRFAERAYVLAEIVSDTDHDPVPGTREPWIDVKRRLYLSHSPCEAVVLIEPNRVDVRIDLRGATGWVSARFTSLDDTLRIPSCGVACRIAALYAWTPLGAPPSAS